MFGVNIDKFLLLLLRSLFFLALGSSHGAIAYWLPTRLPWFEVVRKCFAADRANIALIALPVFSVLVGKSITALHITSFWIEESLRFYRQKESFSLLVWGDRIQQTT
jgi:hypothetical protein